MILLERLRDGVYAVNLNEQFNCIGYFQLRDGAWQFDQMLGIAITPETHGEIAEHLRIINEPIT